MARGRKHQRPTSSPANGKGHAQHGVDAEGDCQMLQVATRAEREMPQPPQCRNENSRHPCLLAVARNGRHMRVKGTAENHLFDYERVREQPQKVEANRWKLSQTKNRRRTLV